jgi:short-subunit dehydrogenase
MPFSMSKKPLCVIITTHMASIGDISKPGSYYYRSTKSALNAAMEGLTFELKNRNIGILLLHPGHVKTRMGGDGTDLLASESVKGMRELVEKFKMENSGGFCRYDGVEMPW